MIAPYPRLMLMQLTVIAGGWCVELLDQPVFALVVLVVSATDVVSTNTSLPVFLTLSAGVAYDVWSRAR